LSQVHFDTSAIIKSYCRETGSNWINSLLDPAAGNSVILSDIAMAEFAAAVALKNRVGSLTSVEQQSALGAFITDCNTSYQLVEVSKSIIARAVTLTQKYVLRGYDAVQLATALDTRDYFATLGVTDFIFVTADNNLIIAATAEGLTVENPNNHP
jgi:uncharacterized protein